MTKIKIIFFLILFCGIFGLAKSSWAATINAASCSQAVVQTAIDGAQDGDTINIPAGSCIWSAAISWTDKNGSSAKRVGKNEPESFKSPYPARDLAL